MQKEFEESSQDEFSEEDDDEWNNERVLSVWVIETECMEELKVKRLVVNVDVDIERYSPGDIIVEISLLRVLIKSLQLGNEFWTKISTVEYKDKILLSLIIL